MTEQTFTMDDTLPTLYIPQPECGHCGRDVQIEDGYAHCDTCQIEWTDIREDLYAQPIHWRAGTEVPCGMTHRLAQREPYDYDGRLWVSGPPQPCILPSGHESDCINPYTMTVTPLVSGNGGA